ncbi:MAG TPA: tetratricopeptide repeat protein [Gemmataceae bacterium]|nr:tetratricopeptide repeat protein [Gemmataceae bacterium]
MAAAKAVEERRRHKVLLIAGSLLVLFLVAGVVGTTYGMFEAKRQKKSAEEGWGKAVTETHRADQNFADARATILDMGVRINQIETGVNNPRLADLERRQALDQAREQFERFRLALPDDENVQRQAAYLHRYAANISRSLSDYQAASTAYAAAIKIYEDLMIRFPDNPKYRDDLGQTLSDRAVAEKRLGRLKEAAQMLESALKLAEEGRGGMSDSSFHRSLGIIENDRTDVAYRLGQFDAASRSASRARELLDKLRDVPDSEKNPIDPLYAAMTVQRFAMAHRELGNTAEALAAHEDAVARMKALNGPKADRNARYWYCEVRRERARTAAAVPARWEAAAEDLVEVISIMEKIVEENPQLPWYREGLAAAYLRRGELLLLLNQVGPATNTLEKSLAVSRELRDRFGPLSDSLLVRGRTFLALGKARAAAGKTGEAASEWKSAVTLFERGLKADPDNYHHNHGLTEAKQLLNMSAK